jgi:hypothetical protein
VADCARRAADRSAALRHQRTHAWTPWTTSGARAELRRAAARAGVRRRFAPHQLRHAHAVEMAREGVPLIVIQRQLGHSNLGITSVYLQGIDNAEIIETVHARRAPMIPVTTSRSALTGTTLTTATLAQRSAPTPTGPSLHARSPQRPCQADRRESPRTRN